MTKPRLVIAALRGGAGKTVVSLGLAAAFRHFRGLRVVPFKKGPDYIDAGWLAAASGVPCYNLDPFLMTPAQILGSFARRAAPSDLAIIEGNRGLYDGVDAAGTRSTAELAKLLGAPVILVLDATKVTRTAAAMVLGCKALDPAVSIAGVILNQVAGKRHEAVLREAVETYAGVPVLGAVARDDASLFPERHMGLVPAIEHGRVAKSLEAAAARMAASIDLDRVWEIASGAPPLSDAVGVPGVIPAPRGAGPVIGVVRDAAFQFYYPENLEALEDAGATLRFLSSLDGAPLPEDLDALYIGGGFPETHAGAISRNAPFLSSLRARIEAGLPVYAECGGLMLLSRSIAFGGGVFPMAGVFPYDVVVEARPQGHGYTVCECVGKNPFYAVGTRFSGHEFHYSRLVGYDGVIPCVLNLSKGHGVVAGRDGVCYKNVIACYTHVHAVGNPRFATALAEAGLRFRDARGVTGSRTFTVDTSRTFTVHT